MLGSADGVGVMSGVPGGVVREMLVKYPEMFKKLCVMHLTLHLDIDSESLSDIDNNKQQHHQPHNIPHPCASHAHTASTTPAQTEIIQRLRSFLKNSKSTEIIPVVFPGDILEPVDKLIDMINSDAVLSIVGLFRVSGSRARQQRLEKVLQEGGNISLSQGECTVFDLCDLLKRFLARLDQPILTHSAFLMHCSIAGMPDDKFHHKLKALQCLVLLLPTENYRLLWRLLFLLKQVSDSGVDNLMNADNLGRIFSPHLLVPKHLSSEEMYHVNDVCNKAAAFMIQHVHEVFTVPDELVADIESYIKEQDGVDGSKLKHADSCVKTTVQFVDKALSSSNCDAEKAKQTAELVHTIASMPDSAMKKKLMKKMPEESHQRKFLTPEAPSSHRVRTGSASVSSCASVGKHTRAKSGSSHTAVTGGACLDSIKKRMAFTRHSPVSSMNHSSRTPKIRVDSPRYTSTASDRKLRQLGGSAVVPGSSGMRKAVPAVASSDASSSSSKWYAEGSSGTSSGKPVRRHQRHVLQTSSMMNTPPPHAATSTTPSATAVLACTPTPHDLLLTSPSDLIDLSMLNTTQHQQQQGNNTPNTEGSGVCCTDAKRLCVPRSTTSSSSKVRRSPRQQQGKPPSPHYNKVVSSARRNNKVLTVHIGGGSTPIATSTSTSGANSASTRGTGSAVDGTPISKSLAVAPKAVKAMLLERPAGSRGTIYLCDEGSSSGWRQ